MAVISWRSDVNRAILDMTTISMGEGGIKENSTESGHKTRRASSLASPVKYSVTMDFNWLEKDENGNSEFDRFQSWYQYKHQYGANPFWFPSISRFNINGTVIDDITNKPRMCQYVITSAPSFSKSGFCMRCTMTWEEVYTGVIQVEEEQGGIITGINAENGKIYVTYSKLPTELPSPTSDLFGKENANEVITVLDCYAVTESYKIVTFYVEKLPAGTYVIGKADFVEANPQPTSGTFSGKNYYKKVNAKYVKATSFESGVKYYTGTLSMKQSYTFEA